MHFNMIGAIRSWSKRIWDRTTTGSLYRILLLSVAVPAFLQGSAYGRKTPATLNADSLHWAAWDTVIGMVDNTPAARYSFYAYRTLAVPCPEIYLRADSLFTEIVKSIPGSQAAFTDRDPRNLDLYRRLRRGEQKGAAFTWEQRPLDPGSVSDSGAGLKVQSWLDLRLPSAAVLLRAASPHLSTLEAASLLYTQLRALGHSDSSLFVIVDSAGSGHLVENNSLISLQTATPLATSLATVAPVLVFNERVVFYPLFGRDDRGIDQRLSDLVSRLALPALPVLSLLDHIRVERLRGVATLPTQQARDWAVIAACGAMGMYNPALQRAWVSCTSDTGESAFSRELAMVHSTMFWADMLSRPVAELAAVGNAESFEEASSRWQASYMKSCGRLATVKGRAVSPDRFEAWGNLWAEDLLDISFDDIIRTRAGTGRSQSLAMSAALDMVRQQYFRLEIDPGDRLMADQTWIVAGEGLWQFNLGLWTRIVDTLKFKSPPPLLTYSYSTAGAWTYINPNGIDTDADNLTVASSLTEAGRQLQIATLRFLAPKNLSRSLTEVMMMLESGELPLRPLPWPATDLAHERPK